MKKHLLIITLFLSVFTFSQSKRTFNIGILLDKTTAELNPIILQFKEQIKAVVGEDATIVFPDDSRLVNDYSLEKS